MVMHPLAERAQQLQKLLEELVYTPRIGDTLIPSGTGDEGCQIAIDILAKARKKNANIFLVGNGGSSAIVSHAKTDMMNMGRLKAITLHESSIITCLANDYGYEQVFSRQIDLMANEDDVLIAVSSSGASQNILNAVDSMQNKFANVITLSGFDQDNPLRKKGDINYWVDSNNYTLVEIAHLFVLHHWADCLK